MLHLVKTYLVVLHVAQNKLNNNITTSRTRDIHNQEGRLLLLVPKLICVKKLIQSLPTMVQKQDCITINNSDTYFI